MQTRTLIFYESSHRIAETLTDCAAIFGPQRRAVVARELTKMFETVLDGSLGELCERVEADADQRRGEFVLLIAGAARRCRCRAADEGRRLFDLLRVELSPSRAAKLAAEISGAPRKTLYVAGGED